MLTKNKDKEYRCRVKTNQVSFNRKYLILSFVDNSAEFLTSLPSTEASCDNVREHTSGPCKHEQLLAQRTLVLAVASLLFRTILF